MGSEVARLLREGPANTLVFGGTDYSIGTSITGIHVRAEAGTASFITEPDVTLPVWLFGGSAANELQGGSGNNLIVPGSGTNYISSSDGVTTPQTADDSDAQTSPATLTNYFQDSGSWSSNTVAAAFNGEELSHAASSGSDYASWTFANLDPTSYYDVYVTWVPISGASTAALPPRPSTPCGMAVRRSSLSGLEAFRPLTRRNRLPTTRPPAFIGTTWACSRRLPGL
jgi:hypothetical protein